MTKATDGPDQDLACPIYADGYRIKYKGDGLGAMIKDGTELTVFPSHDVMPFDVVALSIDAQTGRWATYAERIAGGPTSGLVLLHLGVYATGGEDVGIFAKLDPPTVLPIPMRLISSVHKVSLVHVLSGEDLEAIALLVPFATRSAEGPASTH
jgi:hypothetical protein